MHRFSKTTAYFSTILKSGFESFEKIKNYLFSNFTCAQVPKITNNTVYLECSKELVESIFLLWFPKLDNVKNSKISNILNNLLIKTRIFYLQTIFKFSKIS